MTCNINIILETIIWKIKHWLQLFLLMLMWLHLPSILNIPIVTHHFLNMFDLLKIHLLSKSLSFFCCPYCLSFVFPMFFLTPFKLDCQVPYQIAFVFQPNFTTMPKLEKNVTSWHPILGCLLVCIELWNNGVQDNIFLKFICD
jgi:hypothetical protein